jgi:predicted nucleic-acid-binding Zn-ribbon protein
MGCQEIIISGNETQKFAESHILKFTKKMCVDKKHIKYTRFFGAGTYTMVFILLILYI